MYNTQDSCRNTFLTQYILYHIQIRFSIEKSVKLLSTLSKFFTQIYIVSRKKEKTRQNRVFKFYRLRLTQDRREDRLPPLAALVGTFVVLAGLAAVLHRRGGEQGEEERNIFCRGNRA